MQLEMTRKPTLAVACGGTGGHFYPGLTIAEAFKQAGGEVVLFIGGHHIEEQMEIARKHGLASVSSPAVRLPRGLGQMLSFPFLFLACLRRNQQMLRARKVDLALVMGSFASVPMGLAASRMGIALAIHEGNATLGQANRFLSSRATLLGLSFPLRDQQRTRARQALVGMPIRQQIIEAGANPLQAAEKKAILHELGFDVNKPVVFIFGGSQGALAINQTVEAMLPELPEAQKCWQFIHFTGREENPELLRAYEQAGVAHVVKARDPDIHRIYQIAEAIICRAGASTIFELAIVGKAPLMIPFPGAKENHQMENALSVVEADGGWVIPQDELTPQKLIDHLAMMQEEKPDRSDGIRTFARTDAAQAMVEELMAVFREQGR